MKYEPEGFYDWLKLGSSLIVTTALIFILSFFIWKVSISAYKCAKENCTQKMLEEYSQEIRDKNECYEKYRLEKVSEVPVKCALLFNRYR